MSFVNLTDLLEETDTLTDWFKLGVFLKMPTKDLEDIERRFSAAGIARCKIALFTLWLERNPKASWDQIAQALEKCDQVVMADRICKFHLPPSLPAAAGIPPSPDTVEQHPVQQVQLEIPREKVAEFRKLESCYARLAFGIKRTLHEKQVPLVEIGGFLEELLDLNDEELSQVSTVGQLFQLIKPNYCFLNTAILGDIIERFIGEPLKGELDEYERQLAKFKDSTSMALFKKISPQCSPTVEAPQVSIKLSSCWLDVTIKRFQKLVEHIFKEKSSALANVHVESGCISVTWLARRSAIPSLIAHAQDKTQFMRLVGVLRVSVAGIDILEQEDEEDTFFSLALVRAAWVDSVDAVEMLLSLEADPNSSDSDGDTPLIIACNCGNASIATLLLQARADINQQNNDGHTALTSACSSDIPHKDVVSLLIQYGAHINIKTRIRRTALMIAAECGHTSIVHFLLDKGAPVNSQDGEGSTALMITSERGHSETVRVLLDNGADANIIAWSEKILETALMSACYAQRTICVDLLLAGGADPNLCSPSNSPLTAACFTTGHDQPMDPTILDKLLSAGADPNTQIGQYGYTALMTAADNGYEIGVQILLKASANVNKQNSNGDTALHWAADEGHLGVCKMLLDSGAQASLTNSDGYTPLDFAQHHGHHEVCELLRSIMDSDPTATQDKITKPVQDSSQPRKPSRLLSIKPRRGILPTITSIGRYIKDIFLPDRAMKNLLSNQAQEPTTTNN